MWHIVGFPLRVWHQVIDRIRLRPCVGWLAAALFGCGAPPTDALTQDQTEHVEVDPSGPRVVLRQRIVFEGSEGQTFRTESPEPFSHMARRWHSYPFTVYRRATIGSELKTDDAAMFGRAAVMLFGPLREDGWGRPRVAITDGAGVAKLPVDALEPGRYVVLVGPGTGAGFPDRYPADIGLGRFSPEDEREPLYLSRDGDAWIAWHGSTRYTIHSPLPGNEPSEDPQPGAVFELEGPDGARLQWTLQEWSKSTWFVRDDGSDRVGDVGNLRMAEGLLDIDRVVDGQALPEEEDRYAVLEALGVGSEATVNPEVLRVVPEKLDKRLLTLTPSAECAPNMICNEARFADDGTLVPASLLAEHSRGFKPTFYDPGERSTYELAVFCDDGCAPPPPERLDATKYPVYYAHGFNSSKLTWEDLLTNHVRHIPGMHGWSDAEDVEAFSPVQVRAETLRRNLRQVILDTEASEGVPAGERFLRVNVVAHSMGGLDTRFLIGHPKYNAECAMSVCTDANGQPDSCCAPPDLDGKTTTWAQRVVSLTTLSTPHCGSSFADLGVRVLKNGTVNAGFQLVAKKFLGLDEAGAEMLEKTLFALSQQFCAEFMGPSFPAPNPARVYDFTCVESGDCTLPVGAEAPVRRGGALELPPPSPTTPTVFSFAGVTCVTGSCGDIVDPGLLPSYTYVKHKEGDNDGIVSVASAKFGIYMGMLPHDHFDWTRTQQEAAVEKWGGRLAGWLFGVQKEPAERFHLDWLDRLRAGGY